MHIKLYDFIPGFFSGIPDKAAYFDAAPFFFDLHFFVGKRRIGQTISKRIERLSVKILVSAFSLDDIIVIHIRQVFI